MRDALGIDAAVTQAIAHSTAGKGDAAFGEASIINRLPHGLAGRGWASWAAGTSRCFSTRHQAPPRVSKYLHQALLHVRAGDLSHQVQGAIVLLVRFIPQFVVSFHRKRT